MENERICKGIFIPIEIWKDKNLTWNEKILFIEIDSFTSKEKDCYVSDEYIASYLGISITNANKTLSSLIKKKYIVKTRFDGRRRYVKTAFSYNNKEQSSNDNNDRADLSNLTEQTCQTQQDRLVGCDNIPNIDIPNTSTKENNNDKSLLKESANNITWRNDFDTYMSLVNSGKEKLIENAAYRQCMEECYPNIDYDKTIYKLVEGHWGTVDGWEWCKKHRKTQSLDFYATLKNGIDNRRNIVYKPISQGYRQTYQQPQKTEPYAEELSKPITLQDGTLFNQGIRFYNSKVTNNVVIVPTNAPNRPLGEDWEWDDRYGWYENK